MGKEDSPRNVSCPYRADGHHQNTATEPQRHPLIAWKHFVDDQFSVITRLAFPEPRGRHAMEEAKEEQRAMDKRAHYRWTGRDTTEDYDEMIVQRLTPSEVREAVDATKTLLREAVNKTAHLSQTKVAELYHEPEIVDPFAAPRLSFGGACYYMSETSDNLPSTADLHDSPSMPKWLSVNWFKRSKYSPIHVEMLPGLQQSREAFEDLLDETLQHRRPSYEGLGAVGHRPNHADFYQSCRHGPGVDWMLSLYCRGVLPLQPEFTAAVKDYSHVLELASPGLRDLPKLGIRGHPFSDLLRAVASPPAQAFTTIHMGDLAQQQMQLASAAAADETAFASFMSAYRDYDSSAGQSDCFWRAVFDQDADKAASIIVRWEGQGRNVKDLIDAEQVVEEYLFMDTDPELWPLCEALEKAHSDLLFEQSSFMKAVERCPGLGDQVESLERTKPVESITPAAPSSLPDQPIGILAALTTTHTTRLPDGSVSTKTVLKKRFADGREETTESVKVEYPGHDAVPLEEEKKKGWFWS